MLTLNEKQDIFARFSKIKLSYDHIRHKKVSSNSKDSNNQQFTYMMAIPEGIKVFAWFSIYKDKRVCYILEKQYIYIANVMASSQLNYGIGTIFYGTMLTSTSFCIEEIYYYKGKQIQNYNFIDTLSLYKDIFKNDLGYCNNLGFMHFSMPVIERKITVANVGYNISHIKYISNHSQILEPIEKPIEKQQPLSGHSLSGHSLSGHSLSGHSLSGHSLSQEVVFNVKPTIQNDIYTLHTYHNSKDDYYYGLAYIPTYTTSVMMNSIFRNIKENANLDKLEESDSEEEFENDNIDKFVYLDKSYYMVCIYNNKFKKWTPIKLAEKGAKVISQREMEKNKY